MGKTPPPPQTTTINVGLAEEMETPGRRSICLMSSYIRKKRGAEDECGNGWKKWIVPL